MTLQNGLVHGSKAYLWTDTAHWNPDTGEILAHGTKVFNSTVWPYAVSFSTVGGGLGFFADEIGTANPQGLEELLGAATDALRWYAREGGGGRVMVASYDGKPRLHIIACHVLFPGSGYGPFEPVEIDYFICSCNDSAPALVAAREGYNLKRMRRVIDAQCSTPWLSTGGLEHLGPRVWLGGDIYRIEVGAGGVTSALERTV